MRTMRMGDLVGGVDQSGPPANSDSFLYIDISSVDADSKSITAARRLPAHEAPSRARQRVRAGDVLVSTVRPNLNAVALVPESMDGAIASTGFCVLRPRTESLDASYLFHFVRSPKMVRYLTRLATGASYPAVTERIIMDAALSAPPILDQRHQASALDTADRVITKRRDAIALTDDLLRATFLEMFGDPVTNPESWSIAPLEGLLLEGPQNGLYVPASEYGSGTPIVRIDSYSRTAPISWRSLKRARLSSVQRESYALDEGDLLINRVNTTELVGKTALVYDMPEPSVFESNMMRCRPDRTKALGEYLLFELNSDRVVRQIAMRVKPAVNQASINQGDVLSLSIRHPPLSLQEQFVRALKKLHTARATQESALAESERLFASLQHRAFQGEL